MTENESDIRSYLNHESLIRSSNHHQSDIDIQPPLEHESITRSSTWVRLPITPPPHQYESDIRSYQYPRGSINRASDHPWRITQTQNTPGTWLWKMTRISKHPWNMNPEDDSDLQTFRHPSPVTRHPSNNTQTINHYHQVPIFCDSITFGPTVPLELN